MTHQVQLQSRAMTDESSPAEHYPTAQFEQALRFFPKSHGSTLQAFHMPPPICSDEEEKGLRM